MGAVTSRAQEPQVLGNQNASNTKEEETEMISEQPKKPEVPHKVQVNRQKADTPSEGTTNSEQPKKPEVPHKVQVSGHKADTPSEGSGSHSCAQVGVPVKQMDIHYSVSFLNNNKVKLWVDKDTGHNCKNLYARALSITWSEEPRYWEWLAMKETKEVDIEVASLLNVCWLEIHGKLDLCDFTPGVMYEIFFMVQLNELSYGWHIPVTLRIKFPDGTVRENKVNLQEKPRGQWLDLKVAQFMMNPQQVGEVLEVSLLEYEGGQWKRGLMVKGVTVRPEKKKI